MSTIVTQLDQRTQNNFIALKAAYEAELAAIAETYGEASAMYRVEAQDRQEKLEVLYAALYLGEEN
jgi:hypothetical protein